MTNTIMYGASDDLIEIDGHVEHIAPFGEVIFCEGGK